MEGRMTNGCVGACRLHGCLLAAVCVRACAREHSAAWLCVFACLSHDVLWQSLTNRTGASGGWGGGGETRAWEDAEEGRGAMEPQRGARWLTAVTWGAYNEAKLHSNSWITGQMTHDLTYHCVNMELMFSLLSDPPYQRKHFCQGWDLLKI